jgi:hypothetical protein
MAFPEGLLLKHARLLIERGYPLEDVARSSVSNTWRGFAGPADSPVPGAVDVRRGG